MKKISPTCEVLNPSRIGSAATFCGAPTARAYPASGGGFTALCEEHGRAHRVYAWTLDDLRGAAEALGYVKAAALFLALALLPLPALAEAPRVDTGDDPGMPAISGPVAETRATLPCGGEPCGMGTRATLPPTCAVATGPTAGDPAACGSPGSVVLAGPETATIAAVLDARGMTRCGGTRVPTFGCCPYYRGISLVDAGAGPLVVLGYGMGVHVRRWGSWQVADTVDGIDSCDRWLGFAVACHGSSEQLAFVQGVAAGALPVSGALVAVSGNTPTGTSLWSLTAGGSLSPLYQRASLDSQDVALIEHGGRRYVVTLSGLRAYLLDATAALALPRAACEDCSPIPGLRDPSTPTSAPGVFLGQLPTGKVSRYAATITRDGRAYVAMTAQAGSPLAVWELLPGPAGVLDVSRTVKRMPAAGALLRAFWRAAPVPSRGVAWIPGSTVLLSIDGPAGDVLAARELGPCLAGGCVATPEPLWTYPLAPGPCQERMLDVSVLDGRAVAYAGCLGARPFGDRLDSLIEIVGGLPVRDLLASPGTYLDSCRSASVGYWGAMNEKNRSGWNTYQPHRLLCAGSTCVGAHEGALLRVTLPPMRVAPPPPPPPPPPPTPPAAIFSSGFETGGVADWSAWAPRRGGP